MSRFLRFLLPALLVAAVPAAAAAQVLKGYHERVRVTADSRMDWTFVVSNQSLPVLSKEFATEHDSTKQEFALYVPPDYDPQRSYPVVVFIDAGPDGGGWKNWEPACTKAKAIYIAPHNAGNNVPLHPRVRTVLDALDEVRRRYNTDPDRTYLTGFSGGARIALAIAFALPECCGGAVGFCAAAELRSEVWLRQRVMDRLNVALVTGPDDFNHGEITRWRGPLLNELGVEVKIWDVPNLGHTMPAASIVEEVFSWLDSGVAKRQALARRYPASRTATNPAPTRADQARALLSEGKARMSKPETLYSGLMQLLGCSTRWADLPEGKQAREILAQFERSGDTSWEQQDIAEQRRHLIAHAKCLDAYASGPLPKRYEANRREMLVRSINLWQKVLHDGKDEAAVKLAKERLPLLRAHLSGLSDGS